MFSVITLIHNQAKNLPIVLRAYEEQSVQPSEYIFVLDRCSDESEEILLRFSKNNPAKIIKNENGSNFLAGYCRDLGLSVTEGDVLFLDGDCAPGKDVFNQASLTMSSEEPVISIIKRINQKEDGDGYDPDARESTPWYKGWIFNDLTTVVEHKELSRLRMLTWSCSFFLNRLAINKIKEINKELGLGARLFPAIFDGKWGGEDDHIGHVAMFTDMRIVAISSKHYVTHIWHPPRTSSEYEGSSRETYNKLKEYAAFYNLPGLPYSKIDMSKHVSEYMQNNYGVPDMKEVLNISSSCSEPLDDEQ